jgi:hypothetical protein
VGCELGERERRRLRHVEGRWVHHHRGVHAGERAALEEQDLAASALLGGGPDDAHREADLVRDRRRRDARARGEGGDQVVATGVADVGQRVVLGADRHVQRSRAGTRDEGRRQIADAALDPEPRRVESLGDPGRGALLLEGQLGLPMDATAECEQGRLGGCQALAGAALRIHASRFAYRDRPRQAGSATTASCTTACS